MANYTTATQQMRSTKELTNEIASLISKHIKADRELFITNWIDVLIDSGKASSVRHASMQVAKLTNMNPKSILFYYKGNKTHE